MTSFIDASVLVAMLAEEADAADWRREISKIDILLTSPIAAWEAVLAIARITRTSLDQSFETLQEFCRELDIGTVSIGTAETREAIKAHARFGKGNHSAKLNMGDCFAYACAKMNNARLLYKGNDFSETDLA